MSPNLSLANDLYQKAEQRARWGQFWSKLTGRSGHLLCLEEVKQHYLVLTRAYAGHRAVAINQIQGSEGRSHEFDCHFYPLRSQNKRRWLSVAQARQLGIPLPAVELIQIGDIYFVRDGHHRISVARALGQQHIDAEVTEWHVREPMIRSGPVAALPLA